MRCVSAIFGNDPVMHRLANVHEHTMQLNSNVEFNLHAHHDIPPGLSNLNKRKYKFNYTENVWKTVIHRTAVNDAKDGELLCFMDCDTMVLGDLRPLQELSRNVDLLLTTWPEGRPNTGVYLVKVSNTMRRWMQLWCGMTLHFLENPVEHKPYRWHYGGINQAALGWMTERRGSQGIPGITIGTADSSIWNLTPENIGGYSDKTKVVHLTAWLREACLDKLPIDQLELRNRRTVQSIKTLWRDHDERASQSGCLTQRNPSNDRGRKLHSSGSQC